MNFSLVESFLKFFSSLKVKPFCLKEFASNFVSREPLSGTILSAVLTLEPPASLPVIAPVSLLSRFIPHFSSKNFFQPFLESAAT